MARLKIAPNRRHRSPMRPEAAGGEDRLSSLPDALLRRVLSRLDTRTALSTAVLSRRWARLPRDLPALSFSVADVLPPRYFRALGHRRRARARGAVEDMDGKLLRYLKRCTRRAMRAFMEGIAGILDAPLPSRPRRAAKALYLEFFRPYDDGARTIDRMIKAAVGELGVEHLDVVVLRPPPRDPPPPAYVFPDHLLDDERHRSRLRSLTLGHCVLPPLHRYARLERIVLQDTAVSTPMHAYHALFGGAAPKMLVVHLLCCRGAGDVLEIDAPRSRVEELVVDSCSFRAIELRHLPELRLFACLVDGVSPVPLPELSFGTVPRLTHVNLTFSASPSPAATPHRVLDSLLGGAPASMSRLAVRFTGPERWILPRALDTTLLGLRELLVADVPHTWDISWPRLLLEAAPALEKLHVHVAAGNGSSPEGRPIYWQPRRKFRHQQLREVCMVGFANTPRQTRFLRYLVRVCKPLERVLLYREGRIEGDGFWAWKTVEQRHHPWTLADWISISAEIKHGRTWSKPHVEVTLR